MIAPLTVKKAYDELELRGLIETARGRGTFVREVVETSSEAERLEGLRPIARQLLHEARLSGISDGALRRLLDEESTRLDGARKGRRGKARR